MSQLTRVARSAGQSGTAPSGRSSGGMKRVREESREEAKAFLLFQNLLPELQTVVFLQLGRNDPTIFSVALTCKRFYRQLSKDYSFDAFHFADGCAVFGYESLLTFAVQAGGPIDHKTIGLAVKNGHFFRELFEKYSKDIRSKHDQKVAQSSLTVIPVIAARSGHLVLAQRLCQLFQGVRMRLNVQVECLLAGGKIEEAQRINRRLKGQQRRSEKSLYDQLLKEAILRGNFDTALLAFNKLSLIDPSLRGNRDIYLRFLNEGARFGIVGFLKLAYETWFQQNLLFASHEIDWVWRQMFDLSQISPASHHLECLIYLKAIGFLRPMILKSIPGWADEQSLNWMAENQITFGSNQVLETYLLTFPRYCKPEVVEWALAQGMPITKGVLVGAALSNQVELFNSLWARREKGFSFPLDCLQKTARKICEFLSKSPILPSSSDPFRFEQRVRILPFQRALQMLREKGCEWGPVNEAYHQLALCLYRRNKQQAKDFVRELQMPVDEAFFAAQEDLR